MLEGQGTFSFTKVYKIVRANVNYSDISKYSSLKWHRHVFFIFLQQRVMLLLRYIHTYVRTYMHTCMLACIHIHVIDPSKSPLRLWI
jgi:hypothetical protein